MIAVVRSLQVRFKLTYVCIDPEWLVVGYCIDPPNMSFLSTWRDMIIGLQVRFKPTYECSDPEWSEILNGIDTIKSLVGKSALSRHLIASTQND